MGAVIKHVQKLLQKSPKKHEITLEETLSIHHVTNLKTITKPWGFEIWVSDATDTPYALKIIYLKKGMKTSLQYHNEKAEHNFILAGKLKLHYKDPKKNVIKQVVLEAGNLIKAMPLAIHRLEAIQDTLLVEASTHQLEDVIRLEDDFLRPSGKIESEHKS